MDVLTPRGQATVAQEKMLLRCALLFAFPGCGLVETDKNKPASIDGIIVRDGVAVGIFESKCRDLTQARLRSFGNEWMITAEKLEKGRMLAAHLCAPYFGLVYLVPDKIGLKILIADERGNFVCPMRAANTETQATVNGGRKMCDVAYVNMAAAESFWVVPPPP